MRNRDEILKDHKPYEQLNLEVLLDIRDILKRDTKSPKVGSYLSFNSLLKDVVKKRGRPRKTK